MLDRDHGADAGRNAVIPSVLRAEGTAHGAIGASLIPSGGRIVNTRPALVCLRSNASCRREIQCIRVKKHPRPAAWSAPRCSWPRTTRSSRWTSKLDLQEQGCIVLGPTATIAATLASLSHDRPDVALLDLHLLDGLATPIAATLAAAGVPFALLTGDRLDVLEDAALAGVPRIEKPWGAGDVEQMVGQLLASPSAGLSETLPAAAAPRRRQAPA